MAGTATGSAAAAHAAAMPADFGDRTRDVLLLLALIASVVVVVAAVQEIERQTFSRWLDGLMRAPAAPDPEPIPHELEEE